MKPPVKWSFEPILLGGLLILAGVVLVAFFFLPSRQLESPVKHQPVAAVTTNFFAMDTVTNVMKSPAAAVPPNWPDFKKRVFPVAYQSSNFQWTLADGKDTNVIRKLAHNQLEYQRMLIENDTIFRRQLIYFNQGFVPLAQQALQTGQNLKQITLPGLGGQELTVDVKRTDFRDGGIRGQIYGQLPGQPDSMVTVAFANNLEAFTIISPRDQIYLQAEAHEPGEVVVKSINPQTYGQPQY